MPWIDAFAPAEARYRAEVMASTWGHLAPKKKATYKGYILFAIPEYDSGNPCIIQAHFEGLSDSPWLYEAMCEFAGEIIPCDENGLNPEPGVYRFEGTIRNYEFKGTIRRIDTK